MFPRPWFLVITTAHYGEADLVMTSENGVDLGITMQAADVSRALHSVSKIAGDENGDGRHDILFNNKVGIVVPTGVVSAVMQRMKKEGKTPLATYKRKNGLYVAKFKLRPKAGFTRPGTKP